MSSASSSSNYIKRFWALAIPACLAGLLQPWRASPILLFSADKAQPVLWLRSDCRQIISTLLTCPSAFCGWGQLLGSRIGWLSAISRLTGNSWSLHSRFALGASLCIGCAYFIGRTFIGVPPPLVDGFWSYTEVRIIGAPMAMLNLVIVGYFIATERGKTALLHALVVHGSNISLNILAVELLQLGSGGCRSGNGSQPDIRCVDGRTFDRQELGFKDVREAFEAGWQSRIRQSLHLNGLLVFERGSCRGLFWAQYTALRRRRS